MDNNCGKCNIKLTTVEGYIKCSGKCEKCYHPKCVNVSAKELQIVENNPGIKWFCEICVKYVDVFVQINNKIDDIKEKLMTKINDINDKLNTSSGSTQNKFDKNEVKTFAKVASTSSEVVIIKPKNKQECKKTKEAIIKNIKPSTLEVGITQLKETREGGVLIKCQNKIEQEKIQKIAEKKLSRQYQVKAPELKNPCIKIVDITENVTQEELINCIQKQNNFVNHDQLNISVKVIKKMKKNYMAIIECDPLTSKKILDENSLFINWDLCRVFEYISVHRCFKCAGFNHNFDSCNRDPRCLICAEEGHSSDSCDKECVKCFNCIEAKAKLNLDINVEHSIYDVNCPVYLKKINFQKQKIKSTNNE